MFSVVKEKSPENEILQGKEKIWKRKNSPEEKKRFCDNRDEKLKFTQFHIFKKR